MTEASTDTNLTAALRQALADVFAVETVVMDSEQAGLVHLYGRFLGDSAEAYAVVRDRFHTLGYVPLFREEDGRQVIRAVPGQLPVSKPNLRLAGILFGATVLSTLFAGTFWHWQLDLSVAENVFNGFLFALPLLAILVAHEMGHYLVSQRLGIPVTLPYFIPLPISILGTMGAVIQMKAPPRNRRHLLALGLAGPVAGLVLAIPLLVLGLHLSPIEPLDGVCQQFWADFPPDSEGSYGLEGNSILYGAIKTAQFGRFLPDCAPGQAKTFPDILHAALYGCPPCEGEDILLSPIASAAWAGFLVTGLNLIPVGTLDGGHVMYALVGRRSRYLTWIVIVALVALGVWGISLGILETLMWFLWATLILFLGRRPAVPLDDVTRLEGWQIAVGLLILVIFVLTFSPIPMQAIPIPQAPTP